MRCLNVLWAIVCLSLVACYGKEQKKGGETEEVYGQRDVCEVGGERLAAGGNKDATGANVPDWRDGADTIVGCFDGVNIDTLVTEVCSEYMEDESENGWWWRVRCLSGRLPSIELGGGLRNVFCNLYLEGDLDGNGTDEFGFVPNFFSNWREYSVYTYTEGGWALLVEPIRLFVVFLDDEVLDVGDVVAPSKKHGYVEARMSDWRDCDAVIVDTLLPVRTLPIE